MFIYRGPFSPTFWSKHMCIYMLCFPASSSQPLPSLTPTHYKNLPQIQLVKGDFFLPSGCSVAQILLACLHTFTGSSPPPPYPSSSSPPPRSWQQKQKGNLQNHNVSCLCQCGLRGRITAHSSPSRLRGLYFNKFTYYRRVCKRLLWGALWWVALGTPSPWLAQEGFDATCSKILMFLHTCFHFSTCVHCLLHSLVLFSPGLNGGWLINRSGNAGCGITAQGWAVLAFLYIASVHTLHLTCLLSLTVSSHEWISQSVFNLLVLFWLNPVEIFQLWITTCKRYRASLKTAFMCSFHFTWTLHIIFPAKR